MLQLRKKTLTRVVIFCLGTSALGILPAFAADPLYGLNVPAAGALDFGQINVASGAFTSISHLPGGLILPLGVSASNSISGEYYFGATPSGMPSNTLAVNSSSGAYRFLNTGLTILGFDVSKKLLVASNLDSSGNHIVTIDPTTLTQTQLSGTYAPASQTFVSAGTAVNSIGREVYITTPTSLLVTNLDTGALIRSVSLSQNTAGTLAWDPVSGVLYDFAVPTVSDFRLASINTVTGQVSTISGSNVLSGGIANQGRSLSVIDGVLYVQSLGSTYDVINLATGALKGTFSSSATSIFPQDQVVIGGTSNTIFSFDIQNPNATIIKVGAGKTVLTGQNQNGAGTIINAGTLQIGNGGTSGSLGTGTIAINNNSVLIFNRSDTVTVSDAIVTTAPNGSLTQAGSGTLILTGANTYNGGTTIAAGTLQVGNGGASGTLGSGGVVDNGALIFNRSDVFTVINGISGSGSLTQAGTGTLILNSSNTYSGTTTINSGGTLQVGSGGTNGTLGSGNVVDNGTLNFNHIDSISISNIVSGSGGLGQIGIGTLTLTGANTYSGGTVISSGTLQLGTPTTAGSISGNVLNNAKLQFDRSDTYVFAGNISGSGIVWLAGQGTVILTGTNSYAGDTTVFINSNLQAGNGGTTGSLTNGLIHVGGGTVTFNRSDTYIFSGSITDAVDGTGLTGRIRQIGSGTTVLAGNNSYTGTTIVSAGRLNVTGSISSSAVTVQSGATLNGIGTVGSTTVQSGGTLAPGNSIGTLTVNGNLNLASGANYSVEVSPTAADRTVVSGTAGLNGNFIANLSSGTYSIGQRYTVVTAPGGVSGTFASLVMSGPPTYVKGRLSYDANNAYLNLDANALAPSLSNASANQGKVVTAIDAAVTAGGVPGGGFVTLYSLSGPALNSALDQISGQVGPNTINAVGQGSLSFLTMTAQGGSGGGNFAPGSAYGGADAPHRAQLGAGETRVWGAAYGGHVGLSADAASGAASLSSSNVGLIGGADMAWDDGMLAGVTVGLGRQNFSSGNGTGYSDDITIGVYARKDAGPVYVTAAFGYGSHHIETLRVITVSGTDVLQGKQNADDYGGRIEAGWRTVLDEQYMLSPYFAVAAESFETPAYSETALSGASTFALSFAAHSSTLGRTELGSGLSRDYETENGVMTADFRAAWAHQLDDLPFTQASFQTLPGASFLVTGVQPASDTALLGASIQFQNRSGLFFGFKGETQLGAGTTILEGMGNLGWRW
ncbi:MAG TPA: autotransporter domain-containing protein [Rhizomicrobium sp.]|nr:autotransporter domain-containing protein [Rhizomicrobium sp.]